MEILQHLDTVLDNVSDTVILVDARVPDIYTVMYINKACVGTTTTSRSCMVGKELKLLVTDYISFKRRYDHAKQTKKPVLWRDWYDLPNGHRLMEIKLIPVINEKDECYQIINISRDITPETSWSNEFDSIV